MGAIGPCADRIHIDGLDIVLSWNGSPGKIRLGFRRDGFIEGFWESVDKNGKQERKWLDPGVATSFLTSNRERIAKAVKASGGGGKKKGR